MAKKQILPVIKCADCANAELHQWFKNPIIAICQVKKGERFVANCDMTCKLFKHSTQTHTITHHERYD